MDPQVKIIDYFLVFGAGLMVSFTPCIYPLIPITLSTIVPKAEGSRLKAFYLSLVYVLGIAITYSVLGLIAGLTGTLFGNISTHPLSYLAIGISCILLGLSMLEILRIPIRPILNIKIFPKQGFVSTFLFGLVSGLVIGPCTFPVLSSLLIYVSDKKNIFLGATLLFTFAYGLGFVLILVGTFSGLLASLPKPGRWMVWIKRLCGASLVLIGIYFILKSRGLNL